MKTIRIILFSFLSIGLITGCKKKLDILPNDLLAESFAFTNVTDLEQGVLGIYSAWNGENTMIINAVLSDEVKLSNENRGQWQTEFKYQYNAGTNSFGLTSFYQMINRANRVIAAASKISVPTAADVAQRDALAAEALALRAVAHFELLQRYAPAYAPDALGITYVDYVFVTDQLARQKVSDNLARIEKDLVDAKTNGGISVAPQITPGVGNIRVSKAFIAGIQARVALYKKDWTNAASFATEAITSASKPLATGSTFAGIWTDANDAEVFLRLRRIGDGVGTLWQDTNGDIFFEASEKLKREFNRTTDVRFNAYFLIDPTGASTGGDTAVIKKFYTSSRGPKIVDVKLMRTAEMYLIRAEARAESNDLAGASADINTLRAARIAGYTPITYSDKAVAISDIINERFKELCFEGFRFFDLKRRGMAVARLSIDVTSPLWQNVAANDFHFTLPIPQDELFANPSYTQNPGY
jgi:hypothetical protein